MTAQFEQESLTISVEHFSAEISVSPDTGYRLVRLGLLPKLAGIGRNVRVSRQAGIKWVSACMTEHPELTANEPHPKLFHGGIELLAVNCESAGKILGVSASKISDLVRDGQLPKLPHLQRLVRVPVCSIYGFMAHAERTVMVT